MVISRTRKAEHRRNLIGESNKEKRWGSCDYTKLLNPNQQIAKGQTRLKKL